MSHKNIGGLTAWMMILFVTQPSFSLGDQKPATVVHLTGVKVQGSRAIISRSLLKTSSSNWWWDNRSEDEESASPTSYFVASKNKKEKLPAALVKRCSYYEGVVTQGVGGN
jgi:hypothetical protein